MSGQAPVNELESMFESLPGVVQEVLHEPFMWLDDHLKMVAGNPQELLDAAAKYQELSYLITGVLVADRADVAALGQYWQGDAHQAFTAHMGDVEGALQALAGNLAVMPQLLQSAADACVEGANMIVELVVSLLALALSTLAISGALFGITAGLSVAAGAVGVLAEAASTMARVAQVVKTVAQVLTKIEEILRKIQAVLVAVRGFFEGERAALASLKAASKGAKGMDWVQAKAAFGVRKAIVSKEIWVVTGGTVAIPGVVGSLGKAGRDYVDGVIDGRTAETSAG